MIKYSLLVKELKKHNIVRRLEIAKIAVEAGLWALTFIFGLSFFITFVMSPDAVKIPIAWLYIILAASVLFCSYNIFFFAFVSKLTKSQALNKDDEIDGVILDLSSKINKHKVRIIWLICGVVIAVSLLVSTVIVKISVNNLSVLKRIVNVSYLLPLLFCIAGSELMRIAVPKKGVKEQIDFLKAHFMKQYGFTEDQVMDKTLDASVDAFLVENNKKIMAEMYRDKKLKMKRAVCLIISFLPILACFILLMIFFMDYIFDGKREMLLYSGIGFSAMFAFLYVALFTFISVQNIWQRKFFNSESEKYKYHLEMLDETVKHIKRLCLILSVAFSAAVLLGGGVFLIVGAPFVEALTYGLLIGSAAIFITMIVTGLTLTRNHRKKLRAIAAKMVAVTDPL